MGPASILGLSDPDEPNGGTRSTPKSAALHADYRSRLNWKMATG
jgi:hypothetical protein